MGRSYKDPMGDRFKKYEACSSTILMKGAPTIIRLDGKAFHTWVKKAKCELPYDKSLINCMSRAAAAIMGEIGGIARFAYIQSDECSIVLNDSLNIHTDPWFGNKVQKITSVAASIMSVNFNIDWWGEDAPFGHLAYFDARVFQVPSLSEMHNAILWRQFDASRNSVSQYAHQIFSQKELYKKSCAEMQEMMFQKTGFKWNDAPTWTKRGVIIRREEEGVTQPVGNGYFGCDWEIPLFNEDPDYLMDMYLPEDKKDES
jgi:tRNA(His) 5'-end guanylyltransferase